jgi:hypothetical protein
LLTNWTPVGIASADPAVKATSNFLRFAQLFRWNGRKWIQQVSDIEAKVTIDILLAHQLASVSVAPVMEMWLPWVQMLLMMMISMDTSLA